MRGAAAWVALLALASCDDFKTPAQLDRVQMVALRSDPVTVPPGGRARLEALLLGPMGIAEAELSWSAIPTRKGLGAAGRIEQETGGVFLVPPGDITPQVATVELAAVADSTRLLGRKAIAVGAPIALPNPTLDPIEVDGNPSDEVRLAPGTFAALRAQLSPDPGEEGQYSWYSTIGEIEFYRSQSTELALPVDQWGEGTVFVVGRDARGGVAWQSVRVLPL